MTADPDWIGFDLDHTLARYRLDALRQLTLLMTVEWLKQFAHFPLDAFAHEPLQSLEVRGSVIDRRLGNVIFIDADRHVYRCVHGAREWDATQIAALYANDADLRGFQMLTTKRYWPTHSYFETFMPGLFARLVQWLDAQTPRTLAQWPAFRVRTYEDVTDEVHSSLYYSYADFHRGMFFEAFRNDPAKYLYKRPFVRRWIERVRERAPNTRVFLATNSMADFTDLLCRFIIGDDWTSLFDLVIFKARKPLFFSHGCAKTSLDELACYAVKYVAPWTPTIDGTPVFAMRERSADDVHAHLFEGGCASQAESVFRRVSGKSDVIVWYCGDHVVGDCRAAAHCCRAWRACAVVEELVPLERRNAVPIASLCQIDDQQYISFTTGDDPSAPPHHVEVYDAAAHKDHGEFFFTPDARQLTLLAKIVADDCRLVVSDIHQLCSERNGDPLWLFRTARPNVQFVAHPPQ